ncbi:uncharacterized protein EV154DRAFT_487292 [Mucor mucedo]|uniref:uncharacterized protein n=1 Tax=Mucor mucedo TaxID=29922 RepID=UPI002220390E|nr:uncharacterized protein EV154DRAFT_487292 [Mucor mucedo]KAI7873313.1 hypothetical protein EV154DRAFT_487292 [Mucor mucedo]
MNSATSRELQIVKYFLREATGWLLRLTVFPSSTDIKTKLESLRRVTEYQMNFETIVSDFPEDLSSTLLCSALSIPLTPERLWLPLSQFVNWYCHWVMICHEPRGQYLNA